MSYPETIYLGQPRQGSITEDWFSDLERAKLSGGEPLRYRLIESCTWSYGDGLYDTSCGSAFYFEDGTAKDNHVNYCFKCGGLVETHGDDQ